MVNQSQHAISVVVCAYNSTSRLGKTLSHLQDQETPRNGFEVILVDNGSTDGTAELAKRSWKREDVNLKIVSETRPGLSHARERGISSSSSDLICFVDDDNHLSPSYLIIAEELLERFPDAAILGGKGSAILEGEAPPWMWQGWQSHAVGAQGKGEGYVDSQRGFVYGAGMVIRREAWNQLKGSGFVSLLLDRHGTSLSSGGDVELCLAMRLIGWRILYSPRLEFGHFMPPGRLTWDYCCRLFRAFGEANALLEVYNPWLSVGIKPAMRRTRVGMLLHQLLELRRLNRQLATRVGSQVGSLSELKQCEAEGKRTKIRKLLKSGEIFAARKNVSRLAAR